MGHFGVFSGVDIDVYHNEWEAVSNSKLKRFARSPEHMLAPWSGSAAMDLGSAVHDALLLPDEYALRYVKWTDTKSKRTKAYEAWEAANPNKVGLLPDEFDVIEAIRSKIMLHPVAGQLLTGGQPEMSARWVDAETGIDCKCRPDYAHPDKGVLVDLKTTRDASPGAFGRDAARYEYHQQGAMYLDGYSDASGVVFDQFIFLAVETSPPYGIGLYVMDDEAVEKGRSLYRSRLRDYKAWEDSGRAWCDYPQGIQKLQLPGWAKGGDNG